MRTRIRDLVNPGSTKLTLELLEWIRTLSSEIQNYGSGFYLKTENIWRKNGTGNTLICLGTKLKDPIPNPGQNYWSGSRKPNVTDLSESGTCRKVKHSQPTQNKEPRNCSQEMFTWDWCSVSWWPLWHSLGKARTAACTCRHSCPPVKYNWRLYCTIFYMSLFVQVRYLYNTFMRRHKMQRSATTPVLRIRIGSGFNGVPGSGSRRAKMTHKSRKKLKIYFLKCWMFSFEGWKEGFFCSLGVL